MDSVILIAKRLYDDVLVGRLKQVWEPWERDAEWGIVENGLRIYLDRDDRMLNDFEPKDRERVLQWTPSPVFYSVRYRNIELLRRVLCVLADDAELLVDNDYGVTLPGNEYVALLRSRPGWDLRS